MQGRRGRRTRCVAVPRAAAGWLAGAEMLGVIGNSASRADCVRAGIVAVAPSRCRCRTRPHAASCLPSCRDRFWRRASRRAWPSCAADYSRRLESPKIVARIGLRRCAAIEESAMNDHRRMQWRPAFAAAALALVASHAAAQRPIVAGEAPAAASSCAPCHGPTGQGQQAAGIPRLAGMSAKYLEAQLHGYRDGRRSDPVMEPVANQLDAADIAAAGGALCVAAGRSTVPALPLPAAAASAAPRPASASTASRCRR